MASKRIGMVISEDLYNRLKNLSDSESETITQTITNAIKNHINNTYPILTLQTKTTIPKIEQTMLNTLAPQEEENIWNEIIKEYKYKCFNEQQFNEIEKHILSLSKYEQIRLRNRLKKYETENEDADNIIINDFFDWILPPLSNTADNLLDWCGTLFSSDEFFNVKKFLRTIDEEDIEKLNMEYSIMLSSEAVVMIPNYIEHAKDLIKQDESL